MDLAIVRRGLRVEVKEGVAKIHNPEITRMIERLEYGTKRRPVAKPED